MSRAQANARLKFWSSNLQTACAESKQLPLALNQRSIETIAHKRDDGQTIRQYNILWFTGSRPGGEGDSRVAERGLRESLMALPLTCLKSRLKGAKLSL
jgi:hypothetical protein